MTESITDLVSEHFSVKDMWVTLTYSEENEPCSEEQARKNMIDFINRLKRH